MSKSLKRVTRALLDAGLEPDIREMADSTRTIALELASAARADVVGEMQLATLMANLDTSCGTCHDADK